MSVGLNQSLQQQLQLPPPIKRGLTVFVAKGLRRQRGKICNNCCCCCFFLQMGKRRRPLLAASNGSCGRAETRFTPTRRKMLPLIIQTQFYFDLVVLAVVKMSQHTEEKGELEISSWCYRTKNNTRDGYSFPEIKINNKFTEEFNRTN